MDLNKHHREIEMKCPSCAGNKFKFDSANADENRTVECTGCGQQLSQKELRQKNAKNIEQHVEELKKTAVDAVRKELQKSFKKLKIKF